MGVHEMPADTDPRMTGPSPGEGDGALGGSRKPRRWLKRVGLSVLVVVAVLISAASVLYEFGGMEPPAPAVKSAYAQMVAAGRAKPVPGRFVVPIPGCVCHSADPAQQVTHSVYRMSECGSCHKGRGPAR